MVRLIKTLFVLSIGSWSYSSAQQSAAQQSFEIPADTIRISDLGLETQVPSATDLVGPEDGPPGRNRAVLVDRLQCWIDGIETCPVADLNDPRVRAIRRFLGSGPDDGYGVVVVHFPDGTTIDVQLGRASRSEPHDWAKRAYQVEVRSGAMQAY